FFTLLFGYAFEATELTGVPAMIIDRDQTEHTAKLAELLGKKKTFAWKKTKDTGADPDLLRLGVSVALVVPKEWTSTLEAGSPMPLQLFLDGTDATSAEELE